MMSSFNCVKLLILDSPYSDVLRTLEVKKFLSAGFDIKLNINRCANADEVKSRFADSIGYVDVDIFSKDAILNAIVEHAGFHILKLRLSIIIDSDIIDACIKKTNSLKIIAQTGVGLDHIDVEYAKAHGVHVIHTPGVNANSVAEFVIAQILMLSRNTAYHNLMCHERMWPLVNEAEYFEIREKVLGIVGAGNVSQLLAEKATALGMKVYICYIPHGKPLPSHSHQYNMVDFNTLLSISDFLSIHVPLAHNTNKLMGEKELRAMKRGSFLINAARGGIVDENALHKVLSEEKSNILGAAIDTHEFEGSKYSSPLCGLARVILSPHIAGTTYESTAKSSDILISKILCSILIPGNDLRPLIVLDFLHLLKNNNN